MAEQGFCKAQVGGSSPLLGLVVGSPRDEPVAPGVYSRANPTIGL